MWLVMIHEKPRRFSGRGVSHPLKCKLWMLFNVTIFATTQPAFFGENMLGNGQLIYIVQSSTGINVFSSFLAYAKKVRKPGKKFGSTNRVPIGTLIVLL
jgi:hypothetical protein